MMPMDHGWYFLKQYVELMLVLKTCGMRCMSNYGLYYRNAFIYFYPSLMRRCAGRSLASVRICKNFDTKRKFEVFEAMLCEKNCEQLQFDMSSLQDWQTLDKKSQSFHACKMAQKVTFNV